MQSPQKPLHHLVKARNSIFNQVSLNKFIINRQEQSYTQINYCLL